MRTVPLKVQEPIGSQKTVFVVKNRNRKIYRTSLMSASSIRKSPYEPSVAPPREGSSSRTTDDTQVRHSQGKAYDYWHQVTLGFL